MKKLKHKFLRQVDKKLSKEYGIKLLRDKTHRVYRGKVNGHKVTIVISNSPTHQHSTNIILRDINRILTDCGVTEPFILGKSKGQKNKEFRL
jgi:hypothetical protein